MRLKRAKSDERKRQATRSLREGPLQGQAGRHVPREEADAVGSTVKTGSLVERREFYVLKSIMKDHIGDDAVLDEMRREIHTMSKLKHPNICRLVEAYERRRHIYLVMDHCAGGDLSGRIPMDEGRAAMVCKKILLAVEYMHSKGVAHRDIKVSCNAPHSVPCRH